MDDLEEDLEANSEDDDFLVDDSEDDEEDPATRKARRKVKNQRQNLVLNYEHYEDATAIYNDEWLEDLYDPTGGVEDLFDDSEFSTGGPIREAGADAFSILKKQYEPEALKALYMTERDDQIRLTDLPERFQLAYSNRASPDEEELRMESEWVSERLVSLSSSMFDASMIVEKVKDVLTFLLCSHYEVPFIEHYRKEFWSPQLTGKDLWKISELDHQWFVLQSRKTALRRAMPQDEDVIAADLRLGEIRRRLEVAQTEEQIHDLVDYFNYHYPHTSHTSTTSTKPSSMATTTATATTAPLEDVVDDEGDLLADLDKPTTTATNGATSSISTTGAASSASASSSNTKSSASTTLNHKRPIRADAKTLAKESSLDKFWMHLGVRPSELAQAMMDPTLVVKLEKNFPLQTPLELAESFISAPRFSSAHAVLNGTRALYAAELSAHPLFRARISEHFNLHGVVSTKPTSNGKLYIDLHHPFAKVRHLQHKPISSFKGSAMFLQILKAVEEGLLEVSIGLPKAQVEVLINEIGAAFQMESLESVSSSSESPSFLWAQLRHQIITESVGIVIPKLVARTKAKLHKEATQVILSETEESVEQILRSGPISFPSAVTIKRSSSVGKKGSKQHHVLEEEVETTPPIAAICVGDPLESKEVMAMVAIIDEHGEIKDTLSILSQLRVEDSIALRELFRKHMPFAVAVGIDTPTAKKFMGTISELSNAFIAEENLSTTIQIIPMPLDVANIFQSTKHAEKEINSSSYVLPTPESASLLRRCASMARRLLDPLLEISGLATQEDHVLGLDLHPLQKLVNAHTLRKRVDNAFIRVVSEVGVDVNRILGHTWMQPVMQFVPGLGPRKALSLVEGLLRSDARLESRNQLKDSAENSQLRPNEYFGPVVWDNAVAFLKVSSNDRVYIRDWNPLDGTRIHPVAYAIAKKIGDDLTASGHIATGDNYVSAIARDPSLLRQVDLNAMIEKLKSKQVYKELTVRSLVEELKAPYADPRVYAEQSMSSLFDLVVGKGTMDMGSVVTVKVVFQDRQTMTWEVSAPHGISGSISVVDAPEDLRRGQMVQAQVIGVDKELFKCQLTCNISSSKWDANAVMDKDPWLVPEDDLILGDLSASTLAQLAGLSGAKPSIVKRSIIHRYFANKSISEVETALASKPIGSFLIHPSSKSGLLTLTSKFYFDTYAHITLEEISEGEQKGALRVDNETYENIDDLVVRFAEPMFMNVQELEQHPCFMTLNKQDMYAHIQKEKRENPQRAPYHIAPSQEKPGYFVLYYIPGTQSVQKEFVRVTPDGYRYRSITHTSLNRLIAYFKKHHSDPAYWQQQRMQQQQPQHLQQQQQSAAYETSMYGRWPSQGPDYGNSAYSY